MHSEIKIAGDFGGRYVNVKMGMLEHSLKTIVFANAKEIVKTDIVAPIASFASNLAVNSVLEFLGEKEKVKKLEEKQEKLDKAYKLLNEKNARTLDFTTKMMIRILLLVKANIMLIIITRTQTFQNTK